MRHSLRCHIKMGDDWTPFYVDFVVMMKNGSVGLFDPHCTLLGRFSGAMRRFTDLYSSLE